MSVSSLIQRAVSRMARFLIQHQVLRSRTLGYRFLRCVLPEPPPVCSRVSGSVPDQRIAPALNLRSDLPRNFCDFRSLPKDRREWGYSYQDVPGLNFPEVRIRSTGPAKIVTWVDEWKCTFPLILDFDDNQLLISGTIHRPEHAALLREKPLSTQPHFSRALWVTQLWAGNYCHWLLYHLPRILALSEVAHDSPFLLPAESGFSRVELQTVQELGLCDPKVISLRPGVCTVDNLVFVEGPPHHPQLLKQLAERLRSQVASNCRSHRRLFVSRANAEWRRLINEDELWKQLESQGFEKVFLETMTFADQIRTFAEAKTIVATHGAGLANTLFCQANTNVIEIGAPDFPCADYYRLALSMDLNYWWIAGESVGDRKPGYRDMMVAPAQIEAALFDALARSE